jgi:hypothetical protein
MRKIKQSQVKSERGFHPSLYMKSSNTIAKKEKNQAKSSQVRTRFSPFATQGLDEQYNSKIKQSQAKSERGFRPSPRMKSSNMIATKMHKSSKVNASLNEVLSFAQQSP